ncbi:MAG: helix-turn-helix transcriptional regulator [Planctomycetes bacterium]|nr:helix-turn-helix transcriptional regulator [Planctomycetota bacterium]
MEEQKPKYPWEIIEDLRIKSGIPKKVLAEKLSINYSYLVDLLNGRYPSKIDNDKLKSLSELLQVPVQDLINLIHQSVEIPPLMAGEDQPDGQTGRPEDQPTPSYVGGDRPTPLIPVFAITSGGTVNNQFGAPGWRQTQASENYPAVAGLTDPDAFGIRLQDDALYPPFRPGAFFVISPQKQPYLGDIILLTLSDFRTYLAELNRLDGDMAVLRFFNPRFEPLMVRETDVLWAWPVVWVKVN